MTVFGIVLRALACALVCGALAPAAHAGAWPKPAMDGQVILTSLYDIATVGFDADGALRDPVYYEKKEISAFIEFGITSRFTLVGRAAWQDVTIETPAGREAREGFGASELGLRAMVIQRDWDVLSVQATVVVPGTVENVSDLRLGEGDYDYEPRVLYGRGFRAFGGEGFAEAQAAWRFRTGAPPDEARVDLTLGWSKGGWTSMAQVFALHATGSQLPRRDYDSVKLQASVARDIGHGVRVQAGAFHTVWGRSIVRETSAFVAVWKTF